MGSLEQITPSKNSVATATTDECTSSNLGNLLTGTKGRRHRRNISSINNNKDVQDEFRSSRQNEESKSKSNNQGKRQRLRDRTTNRKQRPRFFVPIPKYLSSINTKKLLISALCCLLLWYGISITAYFFLLHRFSPSNASWRYHGLYHNNPTSARQTRDKRLELLKKAQKEQLSKRKTLHPRPDANAVEEDDLEVRLKNVREEKQFFHDGRPTSKKTVEFKRKYPRMIHFLHIHKSAGTFLCKQAFRNKMAADYQRNCNVRDDQRCCWYDDNNKNDHNSNIVTNFTREQAINFAKTAPFDFVASEKELSGPMLPDYYDYVVGLRDSRNRYKSHWQHLKRDAESRKREVQAFRSKMEQQKQQQQQQQQQHSNQKPHRGRGYGVSGRNLVPEEEGRGEEHLPKQGWLMWVASWLSLLHEPPINHHNHIDNAFASAGREHARWVDTGENPEENPSHWNLTIIDPTDGSVHPVGNFTKWIAGQPDNYNLRMICGSACLSVPKYQITKELFELTLRKLWVDFSHVLFVEDMEASFARFAAAYGWDPVYDSSSQKMETKKTEEDPEKRRIEESTRGDPYLTVLDDALYEFALRKYNAVPDSSSSSESMNNINNVNSTSAHSSSASFLLLPASPRNKLVWKKDYPAPFQNQDLVDEYFQKGPLLNCNNPCCGYCSKW